MSLRKYRYVFLFAVISFFIQHSSAQQYSQLWGRNGERWDTTKIPDFTNAGYKQGKMTIPVYKSQIDVTKLGAIGDGKTDNTQAFRKAIKQCKKNQAVYVPAGTYLLTDSLVIGKSNICIKGAGAGKTKLFFSKGLEDLYPDYNVHYKNQTQWSWGGAMILFDGNISDCGIENLSVEFPDSLWAGHNFHERSYDGIGFANGAHDGWIKNVTFINADMGIWIERSAHHITAEGWVLDFGPNRRAQKLSGHHGVNIYGGHNLLQDFQLKGKYQHDLSVESEYSVYNVFRNGKGTDICIDHHNHAQSHNLFTNIDAGIGSRIYASGGIDTPRGVCFHETFWNIRAERPMLFCNQYDTKEMHSANNVCVGVKTSLPSQLNDEYGNWFEAIDPSQLYPVDLYKAQMERTGAQQTGLRVLTYNVHHCNPPGVHGKIDMEAIARVIKEAKPDLVALQEIDVFTNRSGKALDQAGELGKLTGMHSFFSKAIDFQGGQYGIVILSKYPLIDSLSYSLPMKEGSGGEPRAIAIVTVALADGRKIKFACTHLDLKPENRLLQVQKIKSLLSNEKLPVILAGDFNEEPGGESIQYLDVFLKRSCLQNCPLTFPQSDPTKEIDLIMFSSSRFNVKSHGTINETYASDHLPLLAELNFQ